MERLTRLILGCLFLFPFSVVIADEEHDSPTFLADRMTEAPLKRPKVSKAMSTVSFPVSNLKDGEQVFFNQGIAAIHGFWTYEAERNFREIIATNPKHPLPYAFAALAQVVFSSGDGARARKYMDLAVENRNKGGLVLEDHEIKWLEAIQALFGHRQTDAERKKRYMEKLTELLHKGDTIKSATEVKAFLALAIWEYELKDLTDEDYKKRPTEIALLHERADKLIEDVLAKYPQHPVHHYKIHLNNRGENNILARNSALRCGKDNPGCAHLWHMPSHIYASLKEYRNAAYNFEAALRVDNAYLAELGLDGSVIHNYAHNIQYFIQVLSANGGIDRAMQIAKHAISGPSFLESHSDEMDPVDWTVRHMIDLMEEHMLWKEADDWVRQGIFSSHHFHREGDLLDRAYYYRFLGLVAAKQGRADDAQNSLNLLKRLREDYSHQEPVEKVKMATLTTLQNLEKDLSLWLHVSDQTNPLEITDTTIKSFEAAGVTPLHLIAEMVGKLGDSHEAEAIAKRAVERDPGNVMPLSVYVYLLIANGNEGAAKRKWQELKNLVHVPIAADKVDSGYSIAGAYPYLKAIQDQFWQKGWIAEPNKETFYTVTKSKQHTKVSWEKSNNAEVMKGPLLLPYPSRFVGEENKTWAAMPMKASEAFKGYIEKGIPKQKKLLIVFRLKNDCEACNEQQANVLKDWAKKYQEQGIEIVFVTPDKELPKADVDPVSVVADPDFILYKYYGSFDEFRNQAAHGVFLIDSSGATLWRRTGDHIFKEWEKLLKESIRLNGITSRK